jgi:hypothetical protein
MLVEKRSMNNKFNRTNSKYTWTWKRANNKHFLELKEGEKRLAIVKDQWQSFHTCSCGPDHNCYSGGYTYKDKLQQKTIVAYLGGKNIGNFATIPDAKKAIHKLL